MAGLLEVGGRTIGPGRACFVIAEAGVNHNGRLELAKRLVDAAADAGADAVKFQTFQADRVAASGAPKAAYQRETTDPEESQLEMLRRLELSRRDHEVLIHRCRERGIAFLSTPYDEESADLLEDLDVEAFKISSGEIVNRPLLEHVASKRRPILLSTGAAHLSEVDEAVLAIEESGDPPLGLLHCVSRYPADPETMNLCAMRTLSAAFGRPVGLSDHSLGIEIALAAAALGACVLEKHLTLDRGLPGPDHRASLEPDAFREMAAGVRKIESALGDGRKRPHSSEYEGRRLGYRGLVAARPMTAGAVLAGEDVKALRTGSGVSVRDLRWVVGRRLARPVEAGRPICAEDLV